MSILDEIRAEVGAVFSDTSLFFSPATLTRITVTSGGGWHEPETTAEMHDCAALVEAYSDHLRAVGDIPDTDLRLMIVGTSIAVDPLKGDTVRIRGKAYALIRVDVDPARAMWTAQARPV